MSNSLGIDLTNKVVVLLKSSLLPEYHDIANRLFRVDGGFGASPNTIGSAIFGTFLIDNEACRMDGHDVERLATDEDFE